jgi:hypothetical protein
VIFLAQTAPQGSRLRITVPNNMFIRQELTTVKETIAQLRQQAGLTGGVPVLVQHSFHSGGHLLQQAMWPFANAGGHDDLEAADEAGYEVVSDDDE